MKWYKLYLEAQICGVLSQKYVGPLKLRALIVLALARRDSAANLLRSREEFYAELRRLSSTGAVGAARMPWPSPEAFAQEIRAAAHAQPREDGVAHPVDALVARLYEGALADGWLQAAFVHLYHQPAALAELIRGLAWVPQKPRAGIDLTPAGLAHKDASVRESATRLVEHWRDRRLLEPLKQFAEREREPWLCEYMRDVIADLS